MKGILVIIAVIAFIGCKPAPQDINGEAKISSDIVGKLTDIKFEEETHNFGNIMQGEVVKYSFKFKNTGDYDLIISSATGSCGCTVPNWPKQPIPPGKEGYIDIEFNSAGKSGKQDKTVSIITNCDPSTRVVHVLSDVAVPKDNIVKPDASVTTQ